MVYFYFACRKRRKKSTQRKTHKYYYKWRVADTGVNQLTLIRNGRKVASDRQSNETVIKLATKGKVHYYCSCMGLVGVLLPVRLGKCIE